MMAVRQRMYWRHKAHHRELQFREGVQPLASQNCLERYPSNCARQHEWHASQQQRIRVVASVAVDC